MELADPYWAERDGLHESQFRAAWSMHPIPGDEAVARRAWRDAIADEIDYPGSTAERAITAALNAAPDHHGDFATQLAHIGEWIVGTDDDDESHFSERQSPFSPVPS